MSDRVLPRLGWAVASVVFLLNLRALAPTITAGDSAELAAAQATLGIAHSPGYPLFSLAGKAFSVLLPFGNPAYRANLFSAVCAALAAGLFYAILRFWTRSSFLAAAAALFFSLLPAQRGPSVVTEVFSLNLALALGLVWTAAVHFHRGSRTFFQGACLFGFLTGLGMGNQHTLILAVPFGIALALPLLTARETRREAFRALAGSLGFGLLGLSVYAFLPIRAFRQPLLGWEDPRTWERFWGVVSRARYGTLQLAQGPSAALTPARLWERSVFLFNSLKEQAAWPVTVLLSAGTLWTLLRGGRRATAWALALLGFLSGPLFFALSNVGVQGEGAGILARFLPLPFAAFFLLGLMGFQSAWLQIPAAAILAVSLFFIPRFAGLREDFLLYDYGRDVLQTLPPRSTLFADRADETEFALAYLLDAEGRRSDLHFVDCNAGVTRSIYGDGYYRIWGKPRLAIREARERAWIAAGGYPVYYATLDPGMIAIPRLPDGLLFRAAPLRESGFPWDALYALRRDAAHPGFREAPLLSSYDRLLGDYALGLGRYEESEDYYKEMILAEPDAPWAHSIALKYYEKGCDAQAEKFFLLALRGDPDPYAVECNLGVLYERENKPESAEKAYEEAARMNPGAFQAHYNLGALCWKRNRWPQAAREFGLAAASDPGRGDVRRYLEAARARAGR